MAETGSDTSGMRARGVGAGGQGGESGMRDQGQSAMDRMTETASDMWESARERGQQMYRQGGRAMGDMDTMTMTGLVVAGAIGFAMGWLIFGNRYADNMVRGMSRSGRRHDEDERRMRRH